MKNLQKIVIIDDEMILRNGFKYLCDWESHGFTIAGEAANGIEGFHLVEQIRPEIVITDIVMPGMDGISLTAQIKEHFPDTHIIVLSSYDDFSYAKSGFKLGIDDYLLKPELEASDLLHLLERLSISDNLTDKKSTASQFFQEILTFYSIEEELCLAEFRDRGIFFQQTAPYILLVTSYTGSLPLHRFLPSITDSWLKFFPRFPSISCVTNHGNCCILFQIPSSLTAPSEDELSAFIRELEQLLLSPFLFACSSPFSSLEGLSQIYEEMCRLLSYRFYFPDKKLLTEQDIHKGDVSFPEALFTRCLDPLHLENARSLIYSYIEAVQKQAGTDVFTLKKQVENAVYTLIQALSDASFSTDEINSGKVMLFKRMDLSSDCDSLKQVLEETFCSLEDIVKKGTKERESSLFYQIEDYIRQNCDQELKLSELAKRFSINYTYLSTLFYQNTHEHFPDYLNRTRVERAKELLRTTDDSIQCISENSGLMNQGYFSKVFKKIMTCSPKEYRKLYHRKS